MRESTDWSHHFHSRSVGILAPVLDLQRGNPMLHQKFTSRSQRGSAVMRHFHLFYWHPRFQTGSAVSECTCPPAFSSIKSRSRRGDLQCLNQVPSQHFHMSYQHSSYQGGSAMNPKLRSQHDPVFYHNSNSQRGTAMSESKV